MKLDDLQIEEALTYELVGRLMAHNIEPANAIVYRSDNCQMAYYSYVDRNHALRRVLGVYRLAEGDIPLSEIVALFLGSADVLMTETPNGYTFSESI